MKTLQSLSVSLLRAICVLMAFGITSMVHAAAFPDRPELALEETKGSYYELLGVNKKASPKEISAAFESKYPPLVAAGQQAKANAVLAAFETLINPKLRTKYDKSLQKEMGGFFEIEPLERVAIEQASPWHLLDRLTENKVKLLHDYKARKIKKIMDAIAQHPGLTREYTNLKDAFDALLDTTLDLGYALAIARINAPEEVFTKEIKARGIRNFDTFLRDSQEAFVQADAQYQDALEKTKRAEINSQLVSGITNQRSVTDFTPELARYLVVDQLPE